MANAPTSQTNPSKMTWLIIWAAMTCAVFIYGLVGMLSSKPTKLNPSLPFLQIALGAVSFFALIAAVGWLQFKTRVPTSRAVIGSAVKEPLQDPMEFQTHSIVSMAFAENCAINGLILRFLGAPITTYAVFAAGSLLVFGGFILPRGMAYWNAYEAQQNAEKEPSPFSS